MANYRGKKAVLVIQEVFVNLLNRKTPKLAVLVGGGLRIWAMAELVGRLLEEGAQGGWYPSPGSHLALPMSHVSAQPQNFVPCQTEPQTGHWGGASLVLLMIPTGWICCWSMVLSTPHRRTDSYPQRIINLYKFDTKVYNFIYNFIYTCIPGRV